MTVGELLNLTCLAFNVENFIFEYDSDKSKKLLQDKISKLENRQKSFRRYFIPQEYENFTILKLDIYNNSTLKLTI